MGRAMLVLDTEFQRRKAEGWVWAAKNGSRVEFKGPKRSLPQNDLMWALLTDVATQLGWHGRRLTADDWKLMFLDAWHREKKAELNIVPNLDNTGFVNLSTSTSDLAKDEMSELIEIIYRDGAKHGVTFNEPSDAPPASDEGSDDAPSPKPSVVAADPSLSPESGPTDGGIEAPVEPDALPSVIPSDEDRAWLKLVAKMLWAATGVGEQDVLKRQMAGIRENHTPANINDTARAKANSINAKCKLVCFGEASAVDVLPLIAGIAGCDLKDITT